MAHADSLRTKISIAAMHRITDTIIYVSNEFQNTNVPIREIVCVGPLPYYLDCFEISYSNVTLNLHDGLLCLQCMNRIQGTKPDGRKWNRLLDAVVTILKYKKNKIDHAIYIKGFSGVTVSCLTVSTDDVINTNTNEIAFTELTIF